MGLEENIIFVDYDETLEEMIQSVPCVCTDGLINENNFPIQHAGIKSFYPELIHLNQELLNGPPDPALLKAPDFRPATLVELLAFCKSCPKERRMAPLVALGSQWPRGVPSSSASVPCLVVNKTEQTLILTKCSYGFNSRCLFLVVRQ